MFERNIIDLVGLFVENVQSLYPFPCNRGWEALLGPGLTLATTLLPASRGLREVSACLTKAGKGNPSAQIQQDAHK